MIYSDNHIHSRFIRMLSRYIRMPSNCIRMLLKIDNLLAKCNSIFSEHICKRLKYIFNPSNDFRISPHINQQWGIPCTHILTTPPHLKYLFPLVKCSPSALEFSRSNLHDEGTECEKYELVYENKKVCEWQKYAKVRKYANVKKYANARKYMKDKKSVWM